MGLGDQLAVGKKERRIVKRLARHLLVFRNRAANDAYSRTCLPDLRPIFLARPDKAGFVQEVPRGIPDERHFRKDYEITAFTPGPRDELTDLLGVPGKIPNILIDLY